MAAKMALVKAGSLAKGLGGSTRLLQQSRRLGGASRRSHSYVVAAVSADTKARIQERLPGECAAADEAPARADAAGSVVLCRRRERSRRSPPPPPPPPGAVAVAGLSLGGAGAPAAVHAQEGASVDSAVASIVDIVKATGEVVKQGVSAAQTGAEYAKSAYEQVRAGGSWGAGVFWLAALGGQLAAGGEPAAASGAQKFALLAQAGRRTANTLPARPPRAACGLCPALCTHPFVPALLSPSSAGGPRGQDRSGDGGPCGEGRCEDRGGDRRAGGAGAARGWPLPPQLAAQRQRRVPAGPRRAHSCIRALARLQPATDPLFPAQIPAASLQTKPRCRAG